MIQPAQVAAHAMSYLKATMGRLSRTSAMAQNKVQYQRGPLMPEFFDRYGPPEQCEALVRAWR